MAVATSQVTAAMLEKVDKALPELYSLSQLTKKLVLDRMPANKVSAWTAGNGAVLGFRMPVKQYAGGDLAVVSLDNAAFPAGSMPTYQYMTIAYAPLSLSFLLPTGAIMATASPDQSIKNVFKDTMDGALKSFGDYEDSLFFTAGDGIQATGSGSGATPATTNPVYNLEPNFGPQRLALGQLVDIWSADGITKRGNGLYVTAVDPVNKTATLSGSVTGPTNADNITVANLPGPLAAGQTRLGLYNYNSATTTGTTNGLSRSTVPELVTPSYSANSSSLTPAMGLTASDYLIQRRDETAIGMMTGVSHMAQRQAYFVTGDSISEIMQPGGKATIPQSTDRVPGNLANEAGTFMYAGVKHYISKKANRSRIDWFNRDLWKTVELAPFGFWKQPDGSYMFEGRSSGGNVQTSTFFAMLSTTNIATLDPGCADFISSLTIPAGY
jgi:hypothetical protein